MTAALAIDLFCGLGGWADGLLAEGYDVIGFDIERHQYGEHRYPAQLVIQDVLTLHGSQFRDAALIVASPPCQAYSYRAMPWSRAKALPPPCNALFNACFRIQREASEAAGWRIPLIVENVRGAQKWVGRARWNFGSYYLWGDVPALMPIIAPRLILKAQPYQRRHGTGSWFAIDMASSRAGVTKPEDAQPSDGRKVPGFRFDGSGGSFQTASVETTGHKSQGMNWSDRTINGQDFTRIAGRQAAGTANGTIGRLHMDGIKGVPHRTAGHWTNPAEHESGTKHPETGHAWYRTGPGRFPSSSPRRKAASAMIARIPLPLARHIAAVFRPEARP
jgi:hypothetical protein